MSRLGKLARMLGVVGGLGAVAWAMRDRFISIAVPGEPKAPAFRTPPQPTRPVPERTPGENTAGLVDDLTQISGIGPVFAARLQAAGINTYGAVADSSDSRLGEVAEVSINRVETWRSQAGQLAGR